MAGEDKISSRHFFVENEGNPIKAFLQKMANEDALVTAQPVGRRRKSSLHCAVRHNFTSSRGASRSSLNNRYAFMLYKTPKKR